MARSMQHRLLSLLVAIAVALPILALAPAEAQARYGSYFSVGYGHYGHHYHGYHDFHHRYRYRGYGHRYHGHYRHYSPGYHSRYYYKRRHGYSRSYSRHDYNPLTALLVAPAYLAHGILKMPAVIVNSLTDGHSSSPTRTYSDNAVSQQNRNQSAAPDNAGQPDDLLANPAWEALAAGHNRLALRQFSQQAQRVPQQSEARIGYALASAHLGDLDRGIWAVKRALQYDAESLHYLRLDEPLRQTLGPLLDHYEQEYGGIAAAGTYDADAAVMVAMLNYLNDDLDNARRTLAAVDRSRQGPELAKLRRLLDQHPPSAEAAETAEVLAGAEPAER
ncbi:hypothetical protein J2T55_002099 [Methylohalomonas lacus]|uniref:Tetratricopeptide repeat protein n=1 Tax=Methylohalomonas lacus TaxID=398773 RepID=A0AAE3HMT3_9GAMM|nr:hypothetical protein [Methylohalomonas lacus]MCS3904066.1 hypothetical protein [Methylohalomonas lacus]